MDYIEKYYSSFQEEDRLLSRVGQVEFRTNMKYIHQYLTGHNINRILEIGAGTGRYSIALAEEGYCVDALELTNYNINILRSKTRNNENINVVQGNALNLEMYDDNVFDLTLLLGPLYHLCKEEDKVKALSEAVRVTKSGGYIFVSYCMNEAVVIQEGFMHGDAKKILKLTDEFHCINEPSDVFSMVRLEDIYTLTNNLPLIREKIIASDGMSNYFRQMLDEMSTDIFENWIEYHWAICERMDLIGVTNHSLDILRKA